MTDLTPVRSFAMFDGAYLSAKAGDVERTNSHLVRPDGNRVIIHGRVRQASGTAPVLTLQLEGAYDGQVWKAVGSAVTIDPTSAPVSQGASGSPITTDHPFLRLRASVATSNALNRVWFDAQIVVSAQ